MASGFVNSAGRIAFPSLVVAEPRPLGSSDPLSETWLIAAALVLAMLLHISVLVGGAIEWGWDVAPPEPPVIPVELVLEEPPKPARSEPDPQAEPPPAQATQPSEPRASGGAPDLAPGAPAEAGQTKPSEPLSAAAERTARDSLAGLSPPGHKPAPAERDAEKKRVDPADPKRQPGRIVNPSGEGGGDPFLNALRDRLLGGVQYPALAMPLRLSGTPVHQFALARDGKLLWLRLLRSSGVELLDRAAADAVRRAAPFAPLPADIEGEPVLLIWEVFLAPPA